VTPLFPSLGTGNPYQAFRLPTILPTLAVFDTLTVVDRDGTIQPWLATSWSSGDSTLWTIILREGVVFSNGVPLTSEALVVSHQYMSSPDGLIETIGSNLANIETVYALSELTVEITLKEPDAFFPFRMALWKIPEPESWQASTPATIPQIVAGTGPFMISKATRNKFFMEPNPLAWNKAKASGLVITLIPDQLARVQAISSGAADIALQIGLSDRPSIEAPGGRLVSRPSAQVQYIGFAKEHFDETPIADMRVRQALNYAVNKDAIAQIIFEGEVAPTGQLLQPGAPGHVPELEPYPYDPERARALLVEAGFADGLEMTMRVAPASPDDPVVFQQIATDTAKVGVRLTLQQGQPGSMTLFLFNGDFKGAELFSMASRGLDSLGDYRIRACLGLTGNHKPFFCDRQTMDVYAQARAASNFDEAVALAQQAIRLEHINPPGLFLWPTLALDGVAESVIEGDQYTGYFDFIPLHDLARKD
jgi:peptide/nickel transport system substrate-binding protein